MKKIESLTEAQEKRLVEFREEWLKIGLCTKPLDKPLLEKTIINFYKEIGKEKPMFFYFSSPMTVHLGMAVMKELIKKEKMANLGANLWANLWDNLSANLRANLQANLWANLQDNLGANLGDNLWANLGDNLRANLRANLSANLWANLGDNLRDNLWANLGANLWANLGDNLWDNLWANLRANLSANLGDNLWDNLRANLWANLGANLSYDSNFFSGQIDAYWIAYYKFANEIGVEFDQWCTDTLNGWGDIAKSSFWWWPKEGIVFVSERPTVIHKQANGRLHADGEMAVQFKDGWGVYSHKGVRITEKLGAIPSSEWKPEWFIEEKNVEIKRIIAEALGYENLFNALNAQEISQHREYRLFRAENVDVEPMHILTMKCPSTGKTHYGRVPPEIVSARDAATWRNHGIEPESFLVEQ